MNAKNKVECLHSSSGDNLNDKLEREKTGLGERIERARGAKTQIEMAAEMGMSRNTLSRYESEARLPDADWLQKFCTINQVSADWLLFGNNPPIKPVLCDHMDTDAMEKTFALMDQIGAELPVERKIKVTMTVYALFLNKGRGLDAEAIRQVVESLI